jgi:hypothetical protein
MATFNKFMKIMENPTIEQVNEYLHKELNMALAMIQQKEQVIKKLKKEKEILETRFEVRSLLDSFSDVMPDKIAKRSASVVEVNENVIKVNFR